MTIKELHHALSQIVARGEPALSEAQAVLQTPDGPYETHTLHIEHFVDKTDLYLVGDIPNDADEN